MGTLVEPNLDGLDAEAPSPAGPFRRSHQPGRRHRGASCLVRPSAVPRHQPDGEPGGGLVQLDVRVTGARR